MKKIFAVFLCFVASVFANSDDTLLIVNKGVNLPKVVVKDKSNLKDAVLQKNFYNILLNDLKVSSNFEVLTSGDEKGNYVFEYILKQDSKGLNLNVIIKADAQIKSDKNYILPQIDQYPFLAHKGVKDSVSALGLPPVEWMDHKILIARNNNPKKTQIILADYTLTYQKVIIAGGLNLFPKWANKEQSEFFYTAYDQNIPTLYKFDLNTNKATRLLSSSGMLIASDVSEDGTKILATMAPQDQPDVYLYDLKAKRLEKITNYSGIDVNGNFIDNDTRVVFVSDRLGYPNIFVQKIGNSSAEQLVFHGRNNNHVSTYQNYIVYSSREPNQYGVFNIYLMSSKSDYIRQLTASGKNLFPRFSNDGGSIVFIKYLGEQTALGIIRVNANKSFYFPLKVGKIQSIDW
ncbi:Tol-Pal system protein TolB [Campylobacter sp. MIT 99-7217]|uniref:Tol-Pal system protein TolB n=1 Tax=Campylobacter sp. MIT 99-7217 TaxID=535091 RepID=UPI001159034B|nr:Tol-Pal system protein TolB [Campylobacter sp. MIT 99-7217]TQR30318.1 Tol-Pal system protein TolB [Campylobacter sp. MIT 99-7217]